MHCRPEFSSGPLLPTQYFPPAPLSFLLSGGSSIVFLLPLDAVTVVLVASVYPCSASTVLRVINRPSLNLPPDYLPSPPPSLGLLHPPAPPLAPPLLALAANIARKEKYFGDRTGRGEACWLVAGGYAPCGNFPNRPLTVVGERISPPVLTPALRVAHSALSAGVAALARPGGQSHDGSGRVPGATAAPPNWLADLSDKRMTYRRTYTTPPPIGMYPFYFHPPTELAAVG